MFGFFRKITAPTAPAETCFEQECRALLEIARRNGEAAMAVTLLPANDCEGWDYHFTFSENTAPVLRKHLESNGYTVARVFSTSMALREQWPDMTISHPREFPQEKAPRFILSAVRTPA